MPESYNRSDKQGSAWGPGDSAVSKAAGRESRGSPISFVPLSYCMENGFKDRRRGAHINVVVGR